MGKSKRQFIFHQMQQYIKDEDHTSIQHVLKWDYRKEDLFDLKNDDGLTLIHIACFEGQRACLEVFLRRGACVHIKSSVGWTPLHAATLGGKLEVVEYLLSECSADPLAKDEMGCLASDLTMDKDILKTLNKYADDVKVKKDLERLAATLPFSHKRNTYCFDMLDMIENDLFAAAPLTRAQSMFINHTEARELREQYSKSKQTIGGKGLLQIPSSPTYPYDSDNYLTRQNSVPVTQTRSKVLAERELHNEKVIRQKTISAENSPTSPHAVKFFLYDSNKGKVMKNRDSGVFDDDIDAERNCNNSEEHYNII